MFQEKSADLLTKFKKQKNFCSRLYKKERKKYFGSLNTRRISDNKSFWKNIQPFFSEKRKINNKITLADNKENAIFDDHLVSEKLNKFLENAIRGLEINENSYITDTDNNEVNSVEKAINKYRNHTSVLLIKSRLKNIPSFLFNEVDLSEIERELNLINPRKATTSNGIPPKLLQSTETICSETLKTIFNNCLIIAEFPNELKLTDVTPILKTEDPSRAKNYIRFSILRSVLKIFGRILHRQVSSYVDQFLSTSMCTTIIFVINRKMEKQS